MKRKTNTFKQAIFIMYFVISALLIREKIVTFLSEQPFIRRHVIALAIDGVKHRLTR